MSIIPQICFWEPEIPGNTGAAIRLCAVTGSKLHLIKPLGFDLSETKLKRAGLDYHDLTDVSIYENFEEFKEFCIANQKRILAFRTQATRLYTDFQYDPNDILLFGRESNGLSEEVYLDSIIYEQLKLPMIEHVRSMNLTNTASVALYESWRQLGFK